MCERLFSIILRPESHSLLDCDVHTWLDFVLKLYVCHLLQRTVIAYSMNYVEVQSQSCVNGDRTFISVHFH